MRLYYDSANSAESPPTQRHTPDWTELPVKHDSNVCPSIRLWATSDFPSALRSGSVRLGFYFHPPDFASNRAEYFDGLRTGSSTSRVTAYSVLGAGVKYVPGSSRPYTNARSVFASVDQVHVSSGDFLTNKIFPSGPDSSSETVGIPNGFSMTVRSFGPTLTSSPSIKFSFGRFATRKVFAPRFLVKSIGPRSKTYRSVVARGGYQLDHRLLNIGTLDSRQKVTPQEQPSSRQV